MHAAVGNWLLVRSRRLHEPARAGQVVGVPHPDGSPPYVVHWLDDERTSVVFPGSDAVVTTAPPATVRAPLGS